MWQRLRFLLTGANVMKLGRVVLLSRLVRVRVGECSRPLPCSPFVRLCCCPSNGACSPYMYALPILWERKKRVELLKLILRSHPHCWVMISRTNSRTNHNTNQMFPPACLSYMMIKFQSDDGTASPKTIQPSLLPEEPYAKPPSSTPLHRRPLQWPSSSTSHQHTKRRHIPRPTPSPPPQGAQAQSQNPPSHPHSPAHNSQTQHK